MPSNAASGVNDQAASPDTYATIGHGGFLGRFLPASDTIPTADVQTLAQRMLQRQQLPDFVLPFMMQRVAEGLIQQHIEQIAVRRSSRIQRSHLNDPQNQFAQQRTYGKYPATRVAQRCRFDAGRKTK